MPRPLTQHHLAAVSRQAAGGPAEQLIYTRAFPWLSQTNPTFTTPLLEGMFGKYLEKGDYCRESNTDLLVQKRIEQRDNHRPDCWATNPDRCGVVAKRGRRVSSGSLTLSFLLTAERQGPCSAIQRRALGRPHHRARPYVGGDAGPAARPCAALFTRRHSRPRRAGSAWRSGRGGAGLGFRRVCCKTYARSRAGVEGVFLLPGSPEVPRGDWLGVAP
jgi:hypothetical protein